MPHRGEHKVHLNENASKWQDSSEDDIHHGFQVPLHEQVNINNKLQHNK